MLMVHIGSGLISIISGMVVLFLKKGVPIHNRVGNVFFYAMLGMTGSGAFLALSQPSAINTIVASLTFYMIITARMAIKNRSGRNGWREYGAFAFILLVFSAGVFFGIQVSSSAKGHLGDGIPAEAYYFFTCVAGLAIIFDLLMFYRGGLRGLHRVGRHLGRMCFALWVATTSFFLGQPDFFPDFMAPIYIRIVPTLVVVAALVYWTIRHYLSKRKYAGVSFGKWSSVQQ